jgi:thiamine biosynthesis lipoprotein
MRTHILLLFIAITSAYLPGIVSAQWYQQQQAVMGTLINVELWHSEPKTAQDCIDSVFAEMHRIDRLMSPYKASSELSLINREAARHPVKISDELFSLIEKSLQLSELSGGAFDITYASVGIMYDYRQQKHPSDKEIQAQLEAINYRHIILNPLQRTIAFGRPGVKIDLGGIAKGYAVDNSIEKVMGCGVTHALVSAGGDSRILGDKGGRPRMMGIQHPRKRDELALMLPLSDTAISTSGDYERYFIEDGQRYHHIISPRSGKSASAAISATVLGPDTCTTDALSTTLFVMGPTAGLNLIETMPEFDAIIIDAGGLVHYSSGLQPPAKTDKN